MTQAVEELQRFGAALDSARRRMKTAHRTKALEDIREALAEATPFECLRRTPQYQNLKTMAASSPGPGQYRRAAASSTQQPQQQQQQQAVLPDYTGPWEWREVREAGGRISYVRVHAANSEKGGRVWQRTPLSVQWVTRGIRVVLWCVPFPPQLVWGSRG
jgi:hypothetical protein